MVSTVKPFLAVVIVLEAIIAIRSENAGDIKSVNGISNSLERQKRDVEEVHAIAPQLSNAQSELAAKRSWWIPESQDVPNTQDKRLREFVGKRDIQNDAPGMDKRLREFVGKRLREFVGKRDDGLPPMYEDKRLREFVGKRFSDDVMPEKRLREFVGKRLREFVGKRADEEAEMPDKRLREFVGKRLREFVGKRSDGYSDFVPYDMPDKRLREFVGKRLREFVG